MVEDIAGEKNVLIACEGARRRAIETGDLDALEQMVADPFHYAHITGLVEDRASYFARVAANPRYITATSAHDIAVTLRPGHALMHGRSYIATAPSEPFPETSTWFLSVWEKQEGHWKITAYASTPMPEDE